MFNTLLLSLTVALMGCGGGGDDPQPAAPTITTSVETINAPAAGGSYTVTVTYETEDTIYTGSVSVSIGQKSITVSVCDLRTEERSECPVGVGDIYVKYCFRAGFYGFLYLLIL